MDYLDTSSWLPLAEKLKRGERRRADHTCGPGRTLLICHTDKGFDAYCWRCGLNGFAPGPEESWQQRLARLTQEADAERELARSVSLPAPMNHDPRTWPLHARVWLYKAGLTNDEIRQHGFYFNERLARVVMPVREGDEVSYWQARGFNPNRAKYLNPKIDKPGLLAKYKPPALLGANLPIALVEDVLSAIRIAHVTDAWAVLGTSVQASLATALIKEARRVAIWLDPDGAGARGAGKVSKLLRAYGVDCRVVTSDRDPKYYDEQSIRRIISA